VTQHMTRERVSELVLLYVGELMARLDQSALRTALETGLAGF